MSVEHNYEVNINWTGNRGTGTSAYRDYDRSHTVAVAGKHDVYASSDTPFMGDAAKYNPEDFLVASLSSCHMLWYLHLCADAGIIVTGYTDKATGTLSLPHGGTGHFSNVTLHPVVTVTHEAMVATALNLHHIAHQKCFIANSVNFPVLHEPQIIVK